LKKLNFMFIRTELITSKKLIGFSTETSLVNDRTSVVWRKLIHRLKEVKNAVSSDLFSLQIYDFDNFQNFTPQTTFKKYALIEVNNFDFLPNEFERFELTTGKYAVFLHKGTSTTFPKTAQYIYTEWLPNSEYELDDRPHFEVLGENYKGHENAENEEEVWIPIK
jgi:AraC family transcriptional regulator